MISFRANGKLLITSEYAVLNGAKSIAIPTKLGQTLNYVQGNKSLYWTAYKNDGSVWIQGFVGKSENLRQVKKLITEAMKIAHRNDFPRGEVSTKLEFPQEWGWGSSSSLTSLIAQWFSIDALELHFKTSNGSGYDVACAMAKQPIFYRRLRSNIEITPIKLNQWPTENMYFQYLGKKKESSEAVKEYNKKPIQNIEAFTRLTEDMFKASKTKTLINLVNNHELLMSEHLGQESPLQAIFKDSTIGMKSLGAWGGDFALLIIADKQQVDYLKLNNPGTFFSWNEVIR
ncbi:MAG: GYDIA family GHMP kinase [Schleiferiaceae bacterium]|nr:GYDIA family GHMP kinase [Schleiferiaceae bacterium]